MDSNHFVNVIQSLSTAPTRRAVLRGFAALVAGSLLSPITGLTDARARGRRRHRRRRRRVCPEAALQCQICPEGSFWCAESGDCCPSGSRCFEQCGCCPPSKPACCTHNGQCCQENGTCSFGCGCCPPEQPDCCSGPVNHLCYDAGQEKCCPVAVGSTLVSLCPKPLVCVGELGGVPWCCESGAVVCGAGCCQLGYFCCNEEEGRCCNNQLCVPAPEGHCFPMHEGEPARIF